MTSPVNPFAARDAVGRALAHAALGTDRQISPLACVERTRAAVVEFLRASNEGSPYDERDLGAALVAAMRALGVAEAALRRRPAFVRIIPLDALFGGGRGGYNA